MTVKDAVNVLDRTKAIAIDTRDSTIYLERTDPLMLDAFANYVVDSIRYDEDGVYELRIAMRPVKVGA